MKYIKKFESSKIKYYWLLPIDKRFGKAINKVDELREFKKNILSIIKSAGKNKYVFVATEPDSIVGWSWNPFYDTLQEEWYEDNGYIFKGVVMLTDDEIEKIKISENIKKYNL